MDELTLPERLNVTTAYVDANIAAGHGGKTAFFYGDQQITYQEVLEQVNRTGNALRALGLDLEQRVALLLLDCPAATILVTTADNYTKIEAARPGDEVNDEF